MRLKGLAVLCAAGLSLYAGTSAQAGTLQDLLVPGATITVGDKLFSNFHDYTSSAGAPAAGTVVVTPITSGSEEGLRFTFDGLSAGPTSGLVAVGFYYDVQSTVEGNLVSDISLSTVGSATNGSFWKVFETITDATAPNQANNVQSGSLLNINYAHTVFGEPIALANVHKTISMLSSGGTASITSIDQTFSQTTAEGTPAAVPLPSAAWMGMALIGGIGGMKLRRKRMA